MVEEYLDSLAEAGSGVWGFRGLGFRGLGGLGGFRGV